MQTVSALPPIPHLLDIEGQPPELDKRAAGSLPACRHHPLRMDLDGCHHVPLVRGEQLHIPLQDQAPRIEYVS
jgi:hypothetical protein